MPTLTRLQGYTYRADGTKVTSGRIRLRLTEKIISVDGTPVIPANIDIDLSPLSTPSGVSVSPQGTTGATTYGYRIAALDADGNTTLASTTVTTTTGNASLTVSNFNRIAWTAVTGAASYKVYGRTSGSELLIATVTAATYDDTGAVSPSGALPTSNTTGGYVYQNVYANIGASPSGTSYLVEYDPDVDDTTKPVNQKDGFWRNYWSVPNQSSVNLGYFVQAHRGESLANYMPLSANISTLDVNVLLGGVAEDTNKRLRANVLAAAKPEIRYNVSTLKWELSHDGSTFETVATPTVGDITGITAGDGLSGGGTSGTVTLAVSSDVARRGSANTFVSLNTFSGNINVNDGSGAAPSIAFGSRPTYGFFSAGNYIGVAIAGSERFEFNSSGLDLYSGRQLRMTSSAGGTTPNVILDPSAAGVLSLRNGTNAQTFRVYNTFTDDANARLIGFYGNYSGGQPGIYAVGAGTANNADMYIVAQRDVYFGGGGALGSWKAASAGHLLAQTDNSFDIGATVATRPRNIFVASTLYAQNGAGVGALFGADTAALTITDSTVKNARLGFPHYLNAEEPMAFLFAQSDGGANTLTIGGGTSLLNAATRINFSTGANTTTTTGTTRWFINSTGEFLAGTDNSNDIGSSGANRPRDIYVAGRFIAPGASGFVFDSRGRITAPSDGVFTLLDAAQTSFGRLQFGGTTSSFPALKRNGVEIEFRLADDSARAGAQVEYLKVTGAPATSGGLRLGNNIAANWRNASNTADLGISLNASNAFKFDAALDIYARQVTVGDTEVTAGNRTDLTTKWGQIVVPHYTNAEEPVHIISGYAAVGSNTIHIGGGLSGAYNAATQIEFATAANHTTTAGTRRWYINSGGHFNSGSDNSYDIGASAATRPRSIYLGTTLHAQYGNGPSILMGADSGTSGVSDSAIKIGRMGTPHYLTAEEPMCALVSQSDSSSSTLSVGGGSGVFNAATRIVFYTAANNITTSGTNRWEISSAGHFIASSADNTYDIGASGANRPRHIYAGSNIHGNSAVYSSGSGWLGWDARSVMRSPADGIVKLANAAETDFSRLQLGGTTSAFPALKRVGARIAARLADDSANANFEASSFLADVSFTGPGNTATTGVIRLANAGAIYSRNAANTADFHMIEVTSGNVVSIAGGGDNVRVGAATSVLQFGGASSAFPAIKRNGASLEIKLADDSAYAHLNVLSINPTSHIVMGSSGAANAGDIRLLSSGTIAWRNNANTGNVAMRVTGASDTVSFAGGSVYPGAYEFYTAASTGMSIGGGGAVTVTGSVTTPVSRAASGSTYSFGANATNQWQVTTSGTMQFASGTGSIVTASTGNFVFDTRCIITSPGDGRVQFTNAAATAGVGLRFDTDALLELRNRANTDYASLRTKSMYFDNGSTNATISHGTGSPEGVVSANVGSMWLRSNGGAGTSVYIKETGSGNTGWSVIGAGAGHSLLSASHTDTTAAVVQRGDLVTGQGASATWSRLAKGAAGTHLYSDGTDVSWRSTANFTGFGTNAFDSSGTGAQILSLRNSTAGTSNRAYIDISTDTSAGRLILAAQSSTYTTSGDELAHGARVSSSGSGGLSVTSAHASGEIRFYTGGLNERMRIGSGGQVTLPGALAEITATTDNMRLNANGSVIFGIDRDNNSTSESFYWRTNNATDIMELNESGYLGIGAAPFNPLYVSKSMNAALVALYNQSTGATSSGVAMIFQNDAPNDTNRYFYYAGDTVGSKFIVYSNGGIHNYSANNVNLSDARSKNLFGLATTSQREIFRKYEIQLGEYKNDPKDVPELMFVAQQIETVSPELVSDFAEGYLGLREQAIAMRAYKVIQELDAELVEQKSRIEVLENQIAKLIKKLQN